MQITLLLSKLKKYMKKLLLLSCLFLSLTSVTSQNFSTEKKKDSQGYSYEAVKNDKTGVRVYTLKNGLKVMDLILMILN